MMKSLLAALVLGLSVTAGQALDLVDLAPCKPAAAKYCDRSAGMTWANLLRCGAKLAGLSHRVSGECRQVLRRYGKL
jgi:hypothetical protein